nr:DUF4231 domain-containing protein [Streptacidiphilus jeojiense]
MLTARHNDGPVPPAVLEKWRGYKRMSARSRTRFKLAESVAIVGAAAVPVAAAANLHSWIIAALGSIVLVATGMRTIWDVHASWIEQARVLYSMEREISLFAVNAAPYDGVGAVQLLVTTVENLTGEELSRWATRRAGLEAQLSQRTRPPAES